MSPADPLNRIVVRRPADGVKAERRVPWFGCDSSTEGSHSGSFLSDEKGTWEVVETPRRVDSN